MTRFDGFGRAIRCYEQAIAVFEEQCRADYASIASRGLELAQRQLTELAGSR